MRRRRKLKFFHVDYFKRHSNALQRVRDSLNFIQGPEMSDGGIDLSIPEIKEIHGNIEMEEEFPVDKESFLDKGLRVRLKMNELDSVQRPLSLRNVHFSGVKFQKEVLVDMDGEVKFNSVIPIAEDKIEEEYFKIAQPLEEVSNFMKIAKKNIENEFHYMFAKKVSVKKERFDVLITKEDVFNYEIEEGILFSQEIQVEVKLEKDVVRIIKQVDDNTDGINHNHQRSRNNLFELDSFSSTLNEIDENEMNERFYKVEKTKFDEIMKVIKTDVNENIKEVKNSYKSQNELTQRKARVKISPQDIENELIEEEEEILDIKEIISTGLHQSLFQMLEERPIVERMKEKSQISHIPKLKINEINKSIIDADKRTFSREFHELKLPKLPPSKLDEDVKDINIDLLKEDVLIEMNTTKMELSLISIKSFDRFVQKIKDPYGDVKDIGKGRFTPEPKARILRYDGLVSRIRTGDEEYLGDYTLGMDPFPESPSKYKTPEVKEKKKMQRTIQQLEFQKEEEIVIKEKPKFKKRNDKKKTEEKIIKNMEVIKKPDIFAKLNKRRQMKKSQSQIITQKKSKETMKSYKQKDLKIREPIKKVEKKKKIRELEKDERTSPNMLIKPRLMNVGKPFKRSKSHPNVIESEKLKSKVEERLKRNKSTTDVEPIKEIEKRKERYHSPAHDVFVANYYKGILKQIGRESCLCVFPPTITLFPIYGSMTYDAIAQGEKDLVFILCDDDRELKDLHEYLCMNLKGILSNTLISLVNPKCFVSNESIDELRGNFAITPPRVIVCHSSALKLLLKNTDDVLSYNHLSLCIYHADSFGNRVNDLYNSIHNLSDVVDKKFQVIVNSPVPSFTIEEFLKFNFIGNLLMNSREDVLLDDSMTPLLKRIFRIDLSTKSLNSFLKEIIRICKSFTKKDFEDIDLNEVMKGIEKENPIDVDLDDHKRSDYNQNVKKLLNIYILKKIFYELRNGSFYSAEYYIKNTFRKKSTIENVESSVVTHLKNTHKFIIEQMDSKEFHPKVVLTYQLCDYLQNAYVSEQIQCGILVVFEYDITCYAIDERDGDGFQYFSVAKVQKNEKYYYQLKCGKKYSKVSRLKGGKDGYNNFVVFCTTSRLKEIEDYYNRFKYVIIYRDDVTLPIDLNERIGKNHIKAIRIVCDLESTVDYDKVSDKWISSIRKEIVRVVKENVNEEDIQSFQIEAIRNLKGINLSKILIEDKDIKSIKEVNEKKEMEEVISEMNSIIGSFKTMQNRLDLVNYLSNVHKINIVEREIKEEADFILSSSECVGIIPMKELLGDPSTDIKNVTKIVGEWLQSLTFLSMSVRTCHVIFELFLHEIKNPNDYVSKLNLFVSKFISLASIMDIQMFVKYSFSLKETADIISTLTKSSAKKRSKIKNSFVGLTEISTPQESVLSTFPMINNYTAQLLLKDFKLVDVIEMTLDEMVENFNDLIENKFLERFCQLKSKKMFVNESLNVMNKVLEGVNPNKIRKLNSNVKENLYENEELEKERPKKRMKLTQNDINDVVMKEKEEKVFVKPKLPLSMFQNSPRLSFSKNKEEDKMIDDDIDIDDDDDLSSTGWSPEMSQKNSKRSSRKFPFFNPKRTSPPIQVKRSPSYNMSVRNSMIPVKSRNLGMIPVQFTPREQMSPVKNVIRQVQQTPPIRPQIEALEMKFGSGRKKKVERLVKKKKKGGLIGNLLKNISHSRESISKKERKQNISRNFKVLSNRNSKKDGLQNPMGFLGSPKKEDVDKMLEKYKYKPKKNKFRRKR